MFEICHFKVIFDMKKVRYVQAYKHYFEEFLKKQPVKVQNKIFKVFEAIETLERIPVNYLKRVAGVKGLYEIRIFLATNTWRILCFFDEEKLIILLISFVKKSQKTPKSVILKAERLMKEYYNENRNRK